MRDMAGIVLARGAQTTNRARGSHEISDDDHRC